MFLAGHLPPQRFPKAEWEAMPVFDNKNGLLPPSGFYRTTDDRGRAVVGFFPDNWPNSVGYCVRPIVVVRA